jgi:hypothetical protein
MTDTIIFLVGAFVTILWGSMVGMLIYAINTPIKRTGVDNFPEIMIDPDSEKLKRANS